MSNNTFYAYRVLATQPGWQSILRYAIIIAGAVAVAVYVVDHLRHRDVTKYRDLLTVVILVVLLTIGIQVRDIQANRSASANTQAVTNLVQSIAKEKRVARSAVYVNSTSLYSGMLVQLHRQSSQTYVVTLDPDGKSFQLNRTHLIDAHSTYVEE